MRLRTRQSHRRPIPPVVGQTSFPLLTDLRDGRPRLAGSVRTASIGVRNCMTPVKRFIPQVVSLRRISEPIHLPWK